LTDLVVARETALASPRIADRVEAELIDAPQGEAPVVHHFGPGVYIREVHLPAFSIVVGHHHRHEHLNIFLRGSLALLDDNGGVRVLRAPFIFTAPPGRKVAFTLTDCVWQNVYATTETDIDALEAWMFDKSAVFAMSDAMRRQADEARCEVDRADFLLFCAQAGWTPDQVRAMSLDDRDQVPMPPGWPRVTIRSSPIEGRGVFLSAPAEVDEVIGPARIDGKRTPLGRYTNHARTPNARFVLAPNGDIVLVANRRIAGCVGGDAGEEVTVDYRQALAVQGLHVGG
jgi:hypothetical protein